MEEMECGAKSCPAKGVRINAASLDRETGGCAFAPGACAQDCWTLSAPGYRGYSADLENNRLASTQETLTCAPSSAAS
jgi:hypothetical protein